MAKTRRAAPTLFDAEENTSDADGVLGPIPEEWPVVRLGRVTYEGTDRNRELTATRADVLAVDNQNGLTPSDRLLGDDFARYKFVQRGEFAYNPMRLNVGSIGLSGFEKPGLVSPDYIVFGCHRERLDPDFLDLFRMSDGWKAQVRRSGAGSIRIRYYYRDIAEFMVPLPPLAEQRAIVHVLRAVQRAKEAAEAVVASARQLKRSVLRHLFTYGPVPVAEADRVPLKETDYGTHPADWASMPLSACAVVQTGVAKGRKFENEEMVSLPYLRVANVQDGYLDLAEIKHIDIRRSEVARYSLQSGDVLLTEGGDFDKLGRGFLWNGQISECVHQNHVFAVRADRTRLLPEYLSYLTQSDYGKSYFLSVAHKTTNLACINTAKLKALPVLVPPLPIQKRIIESLAGVNQKLAVEQARVSALGELFRSLLRDLMTGRVRVHELGFVPPKPG